MDIAKLGFSIDSRPAKQATDDLNKLGNQAKRTEQQTDQMAKRTTASMRAAEQATTALSRAFGVLGASFSAMKIIQIADDWGQYAVRMKFATQSMDEYNYAQQRMVRSANETFRSINETREAFINISPVLRDMGMTLEQSMDTIDAFSGLLVVAGANAQRGESAMNALANSLQKGRVDAMAWNTIYTTADGVIEHLAETTGKTTTELRRLGAEGKLSAEQLAVAIHAAYGPVQEQMKEMPYTVGGAFRSLMNNISEYIGSLNNAHGATDGFARLIARLAENVDLLMVGIALLSTTAIPTIITSIGALTIAMAKNPIGLMAVGVSMAITYLILLRDELDKFNKEMDALGAVWDIIKDAASALFSTIFNWLKDVLNLSDETTSSIGGFFDAVFSGIADGLDGLYSGFHGTLAAIASLWDTLSHNIQEYMSFAFSKVKEKAFDVMRSVAELINKVTGSSIQVGAYVGPATADIISFGDAAKSAYKQAADAADLGARASYEHRKEIRRINREVEYLEDWYKELGQSTEGSTKLTKDNTIETGENASATSAAAKAIEELNRQREEEIKAQRDLVQGLNFEKQGLRDQIATYGQGKYAIDRLTISRLEERRAALLMMGAQGDLVDLLEREIQERKELIALREDLDDLDERAEKQREMAKEALRMNEEIGKTLTDALMRGFESGKDFAKNLRDTVVNMFKTMVLRPIIEPVMQGVAGSITSALGLGGQGGAGGVGGILGAVSNIKTLAGAFSGSLVSSLASGIGSVGSLLGSSALTSFATGMKGATLAAGLAGPTTAGASGAMGLGAGFAAAAPWLAGAGAVFGIGSMIHKMTKGETRSGGGFVFDPSTGGTRYAGGPSGGYGGQQTIGAVGQLFGGATQTIDSLFTQLGIDARTAFFHGAFESSEKGRGGVFSGGDIMINGGLYGFGGARKGDGYGGTSGSTEEMFGNLQKDVAFSVLEAWQIASGQMPRLIGDMLQGIDVRSLAPEMAAQMVQQISDTVAMVTAFREALSELPFGNLSDLTFDLTASLVEAAGGIENLANGINTYYEAFYSETERQDIATQNLVSEMQALGFELPATRQGFRDLVESLDATDASAHGAVAGLYALAGAADQFYAASERAESELTDMYEREHDERVRNAQAAAAEQRRIEQQRYSEAKSLVNKLMSEFKDLAQAQIRELQQASKETDRVASALQKMLNSQISAAQSVKTMLDGIIRDLRGSGAGISAAEGWKVLNNTIKTGVIPDASKLGDAISAIRGGFDDKFYGSIFERERDQMVLANRLEEINDIAIPQLTVAEQQLQVMKDQLAELRDGTKRAFETASLTRDQIDAIKSIDEKTAATVGLTTQQLEALRTGNGEARVLQNLTRTQIEGILGVKSETMASTGLSKEQVEALDKVDLSTSTTADLIRYMQTALEAESLANKQIATIQSQIDIMQKQYDQLRGLNATMTTLDQGMRLLAKAMKAEEAAKPSGGTGGSGGGSSKPSFGEKGYKFPSSSAAKNYILGNQGLLGGFAGDIYSGKFGSSDFLGYAQYHYDMWGHSENRTATGSSNLGRTHKPGTFSEAQAYIANNSDVLSRYLKDARIDSTIYGQSGVLLYAQKHYDNYGKKEGRRYAKGGDHPGGLRLVGELGPELEATGPSRIHSAAKTQRILANAMSGSSTEMRQLVQENRELKQMYKTMMGAMIEMQQRTTRVLERWEGDEHPVRISNEEALA